MDNLTYHAGLMLKRSVEASGRQPTVEHYLVAAVLSAQEKGGDVDFDQMCEVLIDAANYDLKANRMDKNETIRQLRGY